MEQYTTTSGDQIVVQAANGQIQQVRANVNRLLFNQLLLIWKKHIECGFYLFFNAVQTYLNCQFYCISGAVVFFK